MVDIKTVRLHDFKKLIFWAMEKLRGILRLKKFVQLHSNWSLVSGSELEIEEE